MAPIPMVKIEAFPNNEVRCVFFYARDSKPGTPPVKGSDSGSESPKPPLDIMSKLKTPPEQDSPQDRGEDKPGWGTPGKAYKFYPSARRKLLRAGGALERVAGDPSETVFLTGTLPGSTYEAKKAIAAWSGYLVNGVKAWVAKRVPGKLDMYVWEFQKRGALHLHYAVHIPDEQSRSYVLAEWKAQWRRLIDSVCEKSGVDLWRKNANYSHKENKSVLQADSQSCKKSIARYLSKYISKCEQQRIDNHWKECCPSRLWGISRPLNAILKSMTTTVEYVFGNRRQFERSHQDCLSVLQSWSVSSHNYEVRDFRAKVVVGYAEEGQESWLASKVAGVIMGRNQSLKQSILTQEKLFTEIQRATRSSPALQKELASEYGPKWLEGLEFGEYYRVPKSVGQAWVLSDWHSVVSSMERRGRLLSPLQRHLVKEIYGFYKVQWTSGTPVPSHPTRVPPSEREAYIASVAQLTLDI